MDPTQRNVTIPILTLVSFPALICFLFIFYHAFQSRKQLIIDTIYNHVIFLILIFDFLSILTELPISIYYLFYGTVHTIELCTFWIYWDYTLQMTSLFLTAYASIERYILVFHRHMIQNHKLCFHYIPMICFTIYFPILYFCFLIFVPCPQGYGYDIQSFACGGACYLYYTSFSFYDAMFDLIFPCLIILIFNCLIIIRVILSRIRALGSVSLRQILKRNRRMILQLIGISLLSLIAWLPWVALIIGQNCIDLTFANWFGTYILHYLVYITTSFSPFFALIGLPEIEKKIQMRKIQTQIAPI